MDQQKKKTVDLELLVNLATSWRGSGGQITVQPEHCEYLKLVPLGDPTPTGAVYVDTKSFVEAVDKALPSEPKETKEEPPKEPSAAKPKKKKSR